MLENLIKRYNYDLLPGGIAANDIITDFVNHYIIAQEATLQNQNILVNDNKHDGGNRLRKNKKTKKTKKTRKNKTKKLKKQNKKTKTKQKNT